MTLRTLVVLSFLLLAGLIATPPTWRDAVDIAIGFAVGVFVASDVFIFGFIIYIALRNRRLDRRDRKYANQLTRQHRSLPCAGV